MLGLIWCMQKNMCGQCLCQQQANQSAIRDWLEIKLAAAGQVKFWHV
jgi:hypothetical protein